MTIHYLIDQDIFISPAQTITNPVNCVGVMGKGLALQFKETYSFSYFESYRRECASRRLCIGHPTLWTDPLSERRILNFPTKLHWRPDSQLEYIERSLAYFIHNYERAGITSIAFPKLGCANGGLSWSEVGPLMAAYLSPLPIDVYVYIHSGDLEY